MFTHMVNKPEDIEKQFLRITCGTQTIQSALRAWTLKAELNLYLFTRYCHTHAIDTKASLTKEQNIISKL